MMQQSVKQPHMS